MPAQAFIEGLLLYSLLPYQAADIIHTKAELGGFPSKPLNRREGERSNTFAGVRQRGRD